MHELRWNPLLGEHVIVASHRSGRPVLPKKRGCPFCPGAEEIPPRFDVLALPNRFPSLSPDSAAPGICEVVLYTPRHSGSLGAFSTAHITKLVRLWRERYTALAKLPFVKYVFIFENRGEATGVTLHHPHGQIYAFPFVPPLIQRELQSARRHRGRTGRCLFCDVVRQERRNEVASNDCWTALLPSFARWPYELHIYPRRHVPSLTELRPAEERGLAALLRRVVGKYDRLFGFELPYMMVQHAAPAKGRHPAHHFHIEFYPPHRSGEMLKHRASVESGAGNFINDRVAEECARELRRA